MKDTTTTLEAVKNYYGKTLQGNGDLKTNACCSYETMPKRFANILKNIDEEILRRFYGCGSPIPSCLEGRTVLDLGCGTGRDAYIASYLVGEKGRVIGVDMTDEQLAIAKRHVDGQRQRFNFSTTNVEFKKGYIEKLQDIGLDDNSIDVVISNCVINLSPDKKKVFEEIFRVLKPGGELYFSDVFTDRRIPENLRSNPVLYGECLGGALYIEDFRRLLSSLGCPDFRIVKQSIIDLTNDSLEKLAGHITFYSMTVRAFKLDDLEDCCEDYGQGAIYQGTIEESPHAFILDDHHTFPTGKPVLICGNTASMIQQTRFRDHFDVIGNRSVHHGIFASCSSTPEESSSPASGCC